MNLSKHDKLIYLGAPWLFGIVLILAGIVVSYTNPYRLHGMLMVCTGMICMSIYCVCGLITKATGRKD
ncbi:MAG: hypothetical protein ABIE74_10775 [Pseudomonadota bacterium]